MSVIYILGHVILKIMKLSEELAWRGFVNQTTFKDISGIDGNPINFYFGVDPSASSMTIGNLASAMMVRKFILAGHKATLLVGGATGLIGDPDGKTSERDKKSVEEISANKQAIAGQYRQIFGDLQFEIVDNYEWFKNINYLDFLRDIGRHIPMRQMLGRDFVHKRLSADGQGISYGEFSYVLIQAYDFLHLNEKLGVTLQLCGADQWGNAIAGVDLVRRYNGQEVHVFSTPLIIDKTTGKKFGKSEGGAIWLDSKLTSPYKFYQFWFNLDDEGIEDYIKVYTEINKLDLDNLMAEFNQSKHERKAQKYLAYEVTKLIHGEVKAKAVVAATEGLFGNQEFLKLDQESRAILSSELPNSPVSDDFLQDLVVLGLASSKSQARTFISSGAVQVNNRKITDENVDLLSGLNLIKRGKNSFALISK